MYKYRLSIAVMPHKIREMSLTNVVTKIVTQHHQSPSILFSCFHFYEA